MLISDSHRFVFVKMRKTAGSSMAAILEKYANPIPTDLPSRARSRMRLDRDYHHRVYRAHDELRIAEKLMPPELFESFFKFCFVRNPWDRLVSEYEFLRRNTRHKRHAKVAAMRGIGEFIRMQASRWDAHQVNMVSGKAGKVLIDFAGKFENLEEDWRQVCETLRIPHEALPVLKGSGRNTDYRAYYSDADAERVAHHWRRDIQAFGYAFDL